MRTLITALTLPALLITSALSPASHAHIPSANPMEHSRPFPAGPSRQLEDYRFLDDPARRTDPLDGLRYHRLGASAWLPPLKVSAPFAPRLALDDIETVPAFRSVPPV